MEPKFYAMLLAEYGNRFGELPPSILSEEGQSELMARALQRGRPINRSDLVKEYVEVMSPAA